MAKQINLDDGPQRHQLGMRQQAAGDLTRTAPVAQRLRQKTKRGTFCGSRLPELRQRIDGLIVFEGQA